MTLHIGHQNFVTRDKVLAITSATSDPMKRQKLRAENAGHYLDCTAGSRLKALIHMTEGWIAGSCVPAETLSKRLEEKE